MAILTEKEWSVEVGNMIKAEFYAELRNNIVSDVYVRFCIDGFNVTWSSRHEHGLIRVYEIGKVTQDWLRLLELIGEKQAEQIEASLKGFLNSNLTFNN